MNRSLPYLLVSAALLVVLVAQPAQAQTQYFRPQTGPITNPVTSPYLNLLQRNVNPAISYYGIVRPQFEFRRDVLQLQGQLNTVTGDVATDQATLGLPVTGHPIQFLNLSHYYLNTTGRGGSFPGRASGPTAQGYQTPVRPQAGAGGGGGTGAQQPPKK